MFLPVNSSTGRSFDLKGASKQQGQVELDVLAHTGPAPAGPTGPEPVTGTRALATTLFNSLDGFTTTQFSFHLRGPLIYSSVESALALLDASLRAHGYSLRPGSHEHIWAKGMLTLLAHKYSAPLVGAVNGGLGVATALTRWSLNAMIDIGAQLVNHCKGGVPLPDKGSYLKLPVNRDMRILTDDIATYTFDAMVFGKALQTGLDPASIPPSMRPESMTGRAGVEPSAVSQSSGLAIFASIVAAHVRVYLRDGQLDGKEPPALNEIISGAPDKVIARMQACDKAMHARLETRLPRLNNSTVGVSMPMVIMAAAVLGGYLKPHPVANAIVTATLTTFAFHIFGPAWGDGKFIREMPLPALQGALKATDSKGYQARYTTYLGSQHQLALDTRRPTSGSRQMLQQFMADGLNCMLVSAMMVSYLSQADEQSLTVNGGEWRQFGESGSGMDSPHAAVLFGMASGLASVAATHLLSGTPTPASGDIRDELESGDQTPRLESRETTQLKQLASAFTSDVLIVALYAGGALGAPGAVVAAVGAGLVGSIDFNNLGLDPSRLSVRQRLSSAMESLGNALRGRTQAQTDIVSTDFQPRPTTQGSTA